MRTIRNIWTILKKEFVETFRDKAFVYTNFIGPLIFFPVLLILIGEIASVKIENIKKESYIVFYQGMLPESVVDEINKESKLVLKKSPQKLMKYVNRVKFDSKYKLESNKHSNELFQLYEEKQIDLIIVSKLVGNQYHLSVLSDQTKTKATRAFNLVSKTLDDYNKQKYNDILQKFKISRESLSPISTVESNIRPKQQTLGHHLGLIISFFIIFLLITAIHHPAIHSTIGERDGHTLNFLLMSPLSTREILIGKYINIALQGMLSLIPYGFQLFIAYYNFSKYIEGIDVTFLTFNNFALATFLIFSTSLFLSSISFTLTCMAKSMAQAQTLMSFIIFLVFVPLGLLKGLELVPEFNYAFIPIVNFALGLQDILMHGGNSSFYFMSVLTNIVYSVLLVMYADYFFKAQNILSKGDAGIFEALSFKKIKMQTTNPTLSAILGLTIPFFVINSNSFSFMKNNPLYLTLFNSIFACLVITILVLRFYKTELKSSMGLEKFKLKDMLGSVILVMGMFPIVFYLTSKLPGYESIQQTMSQNMSSLKDLPIWVHLIFFALFPAVCEEIAYRGVILNGFKKRFPTFIAVVTTSLLYCMLYFSVTQIIPSLCLSMAMGFVAIHAKSIYPSILGHLTFSGFAIIVENIEWFQNKEFSSFESFMLALCSLLAMALGALLVSGGEEVEASVLNHLKMVTDSSETQESPDSKDSDDNAA